MAVENLINIDFTNCMADKIGPDLGITYEDIKNYSEHFQKARDRLKQWDDDGTCGFISLPLETAVIEEINNVVMDQPEGIDTLLTLGIGGSSLGAKAIQGAFDNHLCEKISTPFWRVIIQENVDPEGFAINLENQDPRKTLVNVISKSGGTIETLSCFTAVYNIMKEELTEEEISRRLIVCTENMDGALAKISRDLRAKVFRLPSNVGGRFSVLSAVGLFPARAMGVDIDEIMKGAAVVRNKCFEATGPDAPCFLYALILYLLSRKGININVLFPYSDLLRGFANWCRQLLAESLGKKYDRDGNAVFVGQTPMVSTGTTDQHSLLQLYMQGPKDKFVTFFRVNNFRSDELIDELPHPLLDDKHKENLKMSKLIKAELQGTAEALAAEGRPSAIIEIPQLTPYVLGQLFYFFELSTAYAAELYNIDAFDQPGVEQSKMLTLKYLRGEA